MAPVVKKKVTASPQQFSQKVLTFLKFTGIDIVWILTCAVMYIMFFHQKLAEILMTANELVTQMPADPSAVSFDTTVALQQIAVELGTLILTYAIIIAILLWICRFAQTFFISDVTLLRRVLASFLYVLFASVGVALTYGIVFLADQSVFIPTLAWNMMSAVVTAGAFILSVFAFAFSMRLNIHKSHCIIGGGILGILWVLFPIYIVIACYLALSNVLISALTAASK
ncbi:MAG TPA: hypothetical protein VK158_00900 [Acidobacteriota bacterium]|nr:hypothetical protein [Acidobacteriota bacterium]